MKRICFLLLLITGCSLSLSAAHIRGGELFYKYIGPGNLANSSAYTVTLKLYIDCGQNDPGQLDEEVILNTFYKSNNQRYGDVVVARRVDERFISYDPNSNPCISNPPRDVCYRLRFYEVRMDLPNNPMGYIISFQRCCRIEGIRNMTAPSNDNGATYLCEIPGTSSLPDAVRNSSPLFNTNDAVAICVGSGFEFDFSATDIDGDSLSYQFCNAYVGGGPSRGQNCLSCPVPNPGAPPPYTSIGYSGSYSAAYPLGFAVNINRSTGLVTGTAPNEIGQFVVTACVSEYRRGVLINTHRKDIHIKVSDCIPLRAYLNPDYSYCDDFNVTFKNLQVNPTGSVYIWDFGDGSAPKTSTVPDGTIQHLYRDTGTYTVKLRVELAGQCIDETQTKAEVYPGFFPGFTFDGGCLYSPIEFTDTTKSRYGRAAFWEWNFGDETTNADTISRTPTPSWLYHSLGFKTVQLIVESDKGCKDTVQSVIEITERPPINLPFRDTLICTPDSLQLMASGSGVFEWTPNYNISNTNINNPIVYPRQTTVYHVTMTEKGCTSTDRVNVRVVDFVTLFPMPDTTICLTDTFQIKPFSDGLKYTWTSTPNAYINNDTAKSPYTSPLVSTTYEVVARIGSCVASDAFNVNTVPYPVVDAGPDKIICYDDTANIIAYTNGSSFQWLPQSDLINGNTLGPSAHPLFTTTYTLFGYDTLGCPKPGIDRMIVTVRPEIHAFAGNDTAIVTGQPLELHGSGAEFYSWSPESGLSLTSTANPIAEINRNITYVMRAFTAEGCFDLDSINIQVFQTMPDIFVPNAFVPTGRNNELKPKAVGISKLDYFKVFNRWGQLVFQTSEFNKGWDGRVNGVLQGSQTVVWMTSGTDYTGKKVLKRGTAILIR
jgi:hypothetical protein